MRAQSAKQSPSWAFAARVSGAACRVPIDATGTLSNTATASYANDPTPSNDTASDTNTAIVPPIFANGFE